MACDCRIAYLRATSHAPPSREGPIVFPRAIVLLVAIAPFAGCAAADQDRADTSPAAAAATSADVEAAILARAAAFSVAVERASASRWASDAVAAIADFFTDDAIILPPNRAPVRGRAEIMAYWTRAQEFWYLEHSLVPERLEIAGDLVVDYGAWVANTRWNDEPWSSTGPYLAVWRRDADGEWRMSMDMFHVPSDE